MRAGWLFGMVGFLHVACGGRTASERAETVDAGPDRSDGRAPVACPYGGMGVFPGGVCEVEGARCRYECFAASGVFATSQFDASCDGGKWTFSNRDTCPE